MGRVADFINHWEDLYDLGHIKQLSNSTIEVTLIKRIIHNIFNTPTTGLDMLEPPSTTGLDILEPITTLNQMQVCISMYGEYLTQKFNIHTSNNSNRTLYYMVNTKPGYFWSNYTIMKDLIKGD